MKDETLLSEVGKRLESSILTHQQEEAIRILLPTYPMLAGWEWFFLGLMRWFDLPFPSVLTCFGFAIVLLTLGVVLEARRQGREAKHHQESSPVPSRRLDTKRLPAL